jgi:hypothetical protein
MGNSHKNGAIGCCHQNFYRLHIPLYKDIDQETATNIKHRFRKLQEENLITRLLEPNSEVKDYLNDNYRTLKKCSSHSKEGCMIAKFKSPTCVSYTCVPIERELLNVYNITYDRLIIIDFLDDIIKGKVTLEQANNFNQLTNQATKRIKSFKQDHRINIKEEIIISK